jgi:hypothetical protein
MSGSPEIFQAEIKDLVLRKAEIFHEPNPVWGHSIDFRGLDSEEEGAKCRITIKKYFAPSMGDGDWDQTEHDFLEFDASILRDALNQIWPAARTQEFKGKGRRFRHYEEKAWDRDAGSHVDEEVEVTITFEHRPRESLSDPLLDPVVTRLVFWHNKPGESPQEYCQLDLYNLHVW